MTALGFTEEEMMRLEAIFMDKDKEEALRFLLEVIKPKVRAKGSRALDSKKGTGVPRWTLVTRSSSRRPDKHSKNRMANSMEQGYKGSGHLNEGMDFWNMGLDEDQDNLLKEIEELESEVEEIEKRIPPHSVRSEIIQLLEEKEGELKRKKDLLRLINDVKRG